MRDFMTTDWDLLNKARDPSAEDFHANLSEVCRRYYGIVLIMVRGLSRGDEPLAHDVVQRLMTDIAARGIRAKNKGERSFRKWLHGQARNHIKVIRAQNRSHLTLDAIDASETCALSSPDAGPDQWWDLGYALMVLLEARKKLEAHADSTSFPERQPYVSAALFGALAKRKGHAAIAAELGISTDAWKKHLKQGEKKMRELVRAEVAAQCSKDLLEEELRALGEAFKLSDYFGGLDAISESTLPALC